MIVAACPPIIVALFALPARGPALRIVLGGAMLGGCLADQEDIPPADEATLESEATCGDVTAYTPYTTTSTSGDVAQLPWRGTSSTYPNGTERFDGYALPSLVECSSDKRRRSHVDVTAGCLDAVPMGSGTYTRGLVTMTDAGAFRALALGYANGALVKWLDQRSEYRFYYSGTTAGVNPGFKVFARYRTEDDLYVASWRLDGVVQIQKKHCGVYTTLARTDLPAPSARAWHYVRFDAVGDKLALYLDDKLVLTAQSQTFSWGTSGIRIDGVAGVYLDDWRVF